MKRKIYNAVAVSAMALAFYFAALPQGGFQAVGEKEILSSEGDSVNKGQEMAEIEEMLESEISEMKVLEKEIPEGNLVETEEANTEILETEAPVSEAKQIKKLQEEGIENKPEELPVWEGRYDFYETCPHINPDAPDLGMGYYITIYPDGQGGYCSDVKIKGYQTYYFFRANVYGDSREIHLYFKESLFEDREWGWPIKTVNQVQEEEKKPRRRVGDSRSTRRAVNLDEEIMSFVRGEDGGGIYTTLGQLEGMELLTANVEAGGIYLEKVEED